MNNIYTCSFMQTVQTANLNTVVVNDIQTQYNEFSSILSDFLYGADGYFVIDTTLKDVLFVLNSYSKGKRNSKQMLYIRRAANSVRTAISHNEKRLTNPELFTPNVPTVQSPLHLSRKITYTNLIELISAMETAEVCVYEDDHPATLKDIAAQFELMFNLTFSDCYEIRRRYTVPHS